MLPFSNLNPFPFKPKKSKIREDNFYDMQTIGGWSKKAPPRNLTFIFDPTTNRFKMTKKIYSLYFWHQQLLVQGKIFMHHLSFNPYSVGGGGLLVPVLFEKAGVGCVKTSINHIKSYFLGLKR